MSSADSADRERVMGLFFQGLGKRLAPSPPPPPPASAPPATWLGAPPPTLGGPTLRSPHAGPASRGGEQGEAPAALTPATVALPTLTPAAVAPTVALPTLTPATAAPPAVAPAAVVYVAVARPGRVSPVPAPPVAVAPVAPPTHRPAPVAAPAFLKSTELRPDPPPEACAEDSVLPFRPVPADHPPPRPGADRTRPVPVFDRDLARTAGLGAGPVPDARAALPFVDRPAGEPASPSRHPPLQRYASLRAAMATQPARRDHILRVYDVPGEAGYLALYASWERLLDDRPELRVAFQRYYDAYAGWLRHCRP